MRSVAFFTPGLKIGGIERVFLTYAAALSERGYNVTYLVCKDDGLYTNELPIGVKLVSLGNKRLRDLIIPLYQYLKSNQVDFLISGSVVANALCILLSKWSGSKTKIVVSHHNYFNIEQQYVLSKCIIHCLYNSAYRIFAVSKGIADLLLKNRVKSNKLATIYNPIDIDLIQKSAAQKTSNILPDKYILFIGRLVPVKNLPFLMEAYHLFEQKNPDCDLVILGDGTIRKQLEEKSNALHLEHKIHFMESRSNPYPIINQATLIVLPSLSEALPTVILEAFALGKTVVATPTMGAIDLLESGKLGYISNEFDNIQAFSETISLGMNHPISIDVLQEKAIQFSIETQVIALEELLNPHSSQ